MMTRNTIALAAAAFMMVGTASAALANDKDETGGFRIGPLGQVMGSPGGTAFAFAYGPRHRQWDDFAFAPRHRMWRHEY
jgi:hypothetical protein